MQFVSLNTLIKDLLNISRGGKYTTDEPISERQLEGWIHQYRALLIKRDIDKGRRINPNYLQRIPIIELTKEDKLALNSSVVSGIDIWRTNIQIPNILDLNKKSGLVYVGDISGKEIQLMPEKRIVWLSEESYTGNIPAAWLDGGYIYVYNPKGLKYISVKGVFEVPTDVYNIVNPRTNQKNASYDDPYPIPIDKVPILKDMILKSELGLEFKMPTDDINDSDHEVTSDVKTYQDRILYR